VGEAAAVVGGDAGVVTAGEGSSVTVTVAFGLWALRAGSSSRVTEQPARAPLDTTVVAAMTAMAARIRVEDMASA
jgi:hypothetical protein